MSTRCRGVLSSQESHGLGGREERILNKYYNLSQYKQFSENYKVIFRYWGDNDDYFSLGWLTACNCLPKDEFVQETKNKKE